MSLLLRSKFLSLMQRCPSLCAPISTSVRLAVPSLKRLRDLEAGEAILAKFVKTTPRALFLSQFKGDTAAARKKYASLSPQERKIYIRKAAAENFSKFQELSKKDITRMKLYKDAKESGAIDELRMIELASRKPKKVSSPYGLFLKENFLKHSKATGESTVYTMKAVIKEWQNLTEFQKQRYREKVQYLVKQHEADYNNWVRSLSADERALFAKKGHKYLTKAQRSALRVAPLKPQQAFIREAFASIKGKNTGSAAAQKKLFTETIKEASRKWRALSPSQRQSYASL